MSGRTTAYTAAQRSAASRADTAPRPFSPVRDMRAGAGRVTGWSPGEMRGQGHPECGEHEHPGDQDQPASEERAEDTRDHDDEHGDAAHEHDAPGLADPEARSDHATPARVRPIPMTMHATPYPAPSTSVRAVGLAELPSVIDPSSHSVSTTRPVVCDGDRHPAGARPWRHRSSDSGVDDTAGTQPGDVPRRSRSRVSVLDP